MSSNRFIGIQSPVERIDVPAPVTEDRLGRRNIPVPVGGINRTLYESTRHMRVQMLAVALFLSSAASVTATNPLTMAITPLQSFAPTTLTIRLHIEPDVDNRALEVITESGDYYRSSRIQLDGADAPKTTSLEIRNLPAGTYEVRSALINSAGRPRASARTEVIVLGASDGEGHS
jgi:hypothetical protein